MQFVTTLSAVVDSHTREEAPVIDAWHGPADEVPMYAAPRSLDHVADRTVELVFDRSDENGFGYAHSVEAESDRFLINKHTIGFSGSMRVGRRFTAQVTRGNYVMKIQHA